jgi:hypothetical protein
VKPAWRLALVVAVACVTAAFTGCSIGAGDQSSGGARLTVTRDFGNVTVLRASVQSLPGEETAMRFLQRRAEDVETRYGGRFVQAINGISSGAKDGRRSDWFYYVNGIESDVGAAEKKIYGGDYVWWDYRDWTTAMRVPAVVGSFPEPFAHGSEGKRFPIRIDCAQDAEDTCDRMADRLGTAGIDASKTALGAPAGKELLRFVVGRWGDVRSDGAARLFERGPGESGVFMRVGPASGGGYRFDLLDRKGTVARTLTRGAGVVAATRFEEQQPTWVVSGTDDAGLEAAVRLLDERILRDRYAVASEAGKPIDLPADPEQGSVSGEADRP